MEHSKKYKCSFCIYQSDRAYNLKVHQRNRHKDDQQATDRNSTLNTNLDQFNRNQVDINKYNIIANELQNLKKDYITIEQERDQLVSNLNSVKQERLVQNYQQP